MTQTHHQERRQAFRINDQARVDISLLDQHETTDQLDNLLPRSDGFQLLSELQQIDQQLQHQLFKLTDNNPTLASALRLINNKVERLALYASEASNQSPNGPFNESESLQITLSTTGLSLTRTTPIDPGRHCAIRLRLQPTNYAIQSLAKVIYSQLQPDGNYRVGLVFIDLDEAGQDLIAGHILQHQALIRRLERQQLDDDLDP